MTSAPDYRNGYSGDGFGIRAGVHPEQPLTATVKWWSPELEAALRNSGASCLAISQSWQERGPGLAFLAGFASQIRRLEVSAETLTDLSALNDLQNLEELGLGCPVNGLDFTRFPRLRECLLFGRATLGNLPECTWLRNLALMEIRVRDLTALRSLEELERLHLNQLGQLATLEGIEGLPIEEMQLYYLGRLRSIAPAAQLKQLKRLDVAGGKNVSDFGRIGGVATLETLTIEGELPLPSFEFLAGLGNLRELSIVRIRTDMTPRSIAPLAQLPNLGALQLAGLRNIRDIERIGEIRSLEVFTIDRAPKLASLEFLRGLTNLRVLSIRRTRIADGDLSVLLELPQLERVRKIWPHYEHYSHTAQELDEIVGARHPAARQRDREREAAAGRQIIATFDELLERGKKDSSENPPDGGE